IAVGQPVTIGEKKCLVPNKRQGAPKSPARLRLRAGIQQCYGSIFFVVSVVINDLRLGTEAHRHVAGIQVVIAEVLLDYFAFVAQAKNELVVAVVGVEFHDVPKDGPTTYWHHRFGTVFCVLAQTRTETSAK